MTGQQSVFYGFLGGMDQVTPALTVPKGRCIACINHEGADSGYARTEGYERYDGRQSPTAAFMLASDGDGPEAREAARAAITAVPGSGPVRGVASFLGVRYAWRDNAGGTACIMHKATAGGWVAVSLGSEINFTSGGTTEIVEGNTITGATSGATGVVERAQLISGDWTTGDAAGYLVLSAVTGTFVAENLNIGASLNVATIAAAPTAQGFPPGGRYFTRNHNFYGASNLKEMYGVNGVGQAFAFNGATFIFIRTGTPVDAPMRIEVFKKHLFLGFPGGSVQHSEPGEPTQYNAVFGAGEIAVGSEITDFIANVNSLHILTEDQINTLIGSDGTDWVLEPLSNEEGQGAVAFTAQSIGNPLYLDAAGIRSITTTQAFGSFRLGTVTGAIQPTMRAKRLSGIFPTASLVTRGKDLYRVWYGDGTGLSIFFGRKNPEPMLFQYPIAPTCMCSELDVDSGERAFFGAGDGFVYEVDVGTSFDGDEILALLQLPWDHEGNPQILKRWHKVELEMEATPETVIGMIAQFDYGNENQGVEQQNFDVSGGGGSWDLVDWDSFYWSSSAVGRAECWIDGQGSNMSLIIVSKSAEQSGYVFQGLRKSITVRGRIR